MYCLAANALCNLIPDDSVQGAAEQAQKHKRQAEEFAAALREAKAEVAELQRRLAQQQQQQEGTQSKPLVLGRPASKLVLSPTVLPSAVRAKATAQLRLRIR